MLNNTGERILPNEIKSLDEHIMVLRHEFAYQYAKNYLSTESVVIEIGSGEGYGTDSLSGSCKKITGVDIDKDAVDHAQRTYDSKNCTYMHYPGGELPFVSKSVNVVVSFQVIEHVEDHTIFLNEINRILKPGGTALIITPNRLTRLKDGQKPFNKYHLREYTPDELGTLLKRSFDAVESFGISGSEEINEMEAMRIAKLQKAIQLDPLGLRHYLPASIKLSLVKFLRNRTQQGADPSDIDKTRFKITDFKVSTENIEGSLDLLGVCTKAT